MTNPNVDRLPSADVQEWLPDANPFVTCAGCYLPAPRHLVTEGRCLDCREPDRTLPNPDHRYPANRG